ncbi:MAG: Holliday junction resolvase RuvX, partial [Candidatus Doudnabacteria bacterium]|nr:Holliday junction resolvase RuvX [Candidatus Doudnabacteria bacterium]
MTKILALDYGTKRIGVAISDETKTIAVPKPYIKAEEKGRILELIKDQEVDEILLGLPKALKGTETIMTREVRSFGEWLEQETKLPVRLIDERYSTKGAERITKDRELIDSLV